jgi:hypothetical protein
MVSVASAGDFFPEAWWDSNGRRMG